MNGQLTERQREILGFITQSIADNSYSPTLTEIQRKFFFKSPNAAKDHILALERKGYIKRDPGKSRSLRLANGKTNGNGNGASAVNIPIVGRVAAGEPIFAEQNIEGNLVVDSMLVKNPQDVFALRVKGDSMVDASIFDGDFIIAHKQSVPDYNGDIVVVFIDGEATVKKLYKEKDGRLRLQPANESMQSIFVNPADKQVWIAGKVKGVIRKI